MAKRGRPVVANSDNDKIMTYNKRPVLTFTSKHCKCTEKTRISSAVFYCAAHGNLLTPNK